MRFRSRANARRNSWRNGSSVVLPLLGGVSVTTIRLAAGRQLCQNGPGLPRQRVGQYRRKPRRARPGDAPGLVSGSDLPARIPGTNCPDCTIELGRSQEPPSRRSSRAGPGRPAERLSLRRSGRHLNVSFRDDLGGPGRALVAGIGRNRGRRDRSCPHLRHHRTRSSGQETSVSPQEADCAGRRRARRSGGAWRKRVTTPRRRYERRPGAFRSDRRRLAGRQRISHDAKRD